MKQIPKISAIIILFPFLLLSNEKADTLQNQDHFAAYIEFFGPTFQVFNGYMEYGIELNKNRGTLSLNKINFRVGYGNTNLVVFYTLAYSIGSTLLFGLENNYEIGLHISRAHVSTYSNENGINNEVISNITIISPTIGYRKVSDKNLLKVGITPFFYVIENETLGLFLYLSAGLQFDWIDIF